MQIGLTIFFQKGKLVTKRANKTQTLFLQESAKNMFDMHIVGKNHRLQPTTRVEAKNDPAREVGVQK